MKEMPRIEILKCARRDLYNEADRLAGLYVGSCFDSKKEYFLRLTSIHEKIGWIDAEIEKEGEDAE